MDLCVIWENATRPAEQRVAIEHVYEGRLLDLFGTVANALKAKEDWHRHYEPPIHHWTTYNRICHLDATQGLLPSEGKMAHFIVRFKDAPTVDYDI